MRIYTPTSDLQTAQNLSSALWRLSLPPGSLADTAYLFPWVECLNGSIWLEVDTEFAILLHNEAVLDGIADALQPWIDDGALPSNTNEKLASYIEDMRGQSLVVWNAFPQFFKDQSKTYEELVSLNLLSNPRI